MADLVNKVKQLSNSRMASRVEPLFTRCQASRGLSKIFDIDSNFLVSRLSLRKEHSTLGSSALAAVRSVTTLGNKGQRDGPISMLAQFQTINSHASIFTFKTMLGI